MMLYLNSPRQMWWKQRSAQDWSNVKCRRSLTNCCCLVTTCYREHPAPPKPTSGANGNLERGVPGSRRGSPNWRQSIYDSRTLRVVGPRTKERQTYREPQRRQISSMRMRAESCVGLRNGCELWKPKLRRCEGTRKALK